jgi:hypothetical protein
VVAGHKTATIAGQRLNGRGKIGASISKIYPRKPNGRILLQERGMLRHSILMFHRRRETRTVHDSIM